MSLQKKKKDDIQMKISDKKVAFGEHHGRLDSLFQSF